MVVEFVKCKCQKKRVKGVMKIAPKDEQPSVPVYESIDPRWRVGTCLRCGKQVVQKNKEDKCQREQER